MFEIKLFLHLTVYKQLNNGEKTKIYVLMLNWIVWYLEKPFNCV